jgi:hypothetical protein
LSGVIVVVEYDPAWPQRFERLRQEYAGALAAAGVPARTPMSSWWVRWRSATTSPSGTSCERIPSHDDFPR